MNLRFQDILNKTNKSEVFLQELELLILNYLGSKKFKWASIEDMKKKNSVEDSLRKVRGYLDSSSEIRDSMRQLNREHLKLQLAAKNLEMSATDIEIKSDSIKDKLIEEGVVDFLLNEHGIKTQVAPAIEAPQASAEEVAMEETISEDIGEITDENVTELRTEEAEGSDVRELDFTKGSEDEINMLNINPAEEPASFSYKVV